MNCHWRDASEPDASGVRTVRCIRCGLTLRTADPHERIHAACPKAATCVYRGDVLRQQECPTCCGNVRIKVLACEVHGECTLAKALDGVACCRGCRDYSPISSPAAGAESSSASLPTATA